MSLPISAPVTHRLVGWGDFDQLRESILPHLFGHMIRLANPVVKEFHGDLFYDAHWLTANVTGEMAFHFLVRTSGTHVGLGARPAFDAYAPGGILYEMNLWAKDGRDWHLTITELDRTDKPERCPYCHEVLSNGTCPNFGDGESHAPI